MKNLNTDHNQLLKRDFDSIWHPFTPLVGSPDPIPLKGAEGVYLYTTDGRAIIDAVSSWWVNLHGHNHPHITKAVAEQAANLEHVIFAGFTHEPAVKLAETLLYMLPENDKERSPSKIFFSDDGSTSVEVALKMAIQYWFNQGIQKTKIVAIDGGYHGDTVGAMSVGDRGAFTEPFESYLFEVKYLDFPDGTNHDTIISQFNHYLATDDVAAFIYEPLIQGVSGMRTYSRELLDQLIQMAQESDVICIADEVMTGFGRTGALFATNHLETQPDIFCLSKGITGGTLALGATSCTENIIEVFREKDLMKTFFHGHSFTANPIACAAANASMDILMEKTCRNNINRISYQHEVFGERIADHPKVQNIRQLGTILAFELKTLDDTSYFNEARHQLYPFFIERNVLLRPLGNVVYILPPYVISNEELDRVYEVIEEMLEEV